jgi:hypothetical protein
MGNYNSSEEGADTFAICTGYWRLDALSSFTHKADGFVTFTMVRLTLPQLLRARCICYYWLTPRL